MNKKGTFFTLSLFTLVVLLAGVAFVSTVEEVTGQGQEQARIHVNLKAGDALSSETKAPDGQKEQMWVQADYDQGPFTRANKRWVDAGTWTSAARDSAFQFGTRVTFNIWYTIRDEGYQADPEFRFTLAADGTQLVQTTGPVGADNGDQLTEYTMNANFDSIELAANAELSLDIDYRGWEDCDIHYDNATVDSGFFVESDFCMVFSYGGKGDKITTEVYDAWGADWDKVGNYVEISVDGTKIDADFITRDGKKYKVDQEEYQSTLIQWTLEEDLQTGQNVTIWIKYSPAPGETGSDRGFEKGFEVGSGGGGGGGGSSGDGDSDDEWYEDTMILGGIGGVVAIAAVALIFMFVIKPRREAGGDEDEEDEEDEDEDEEDDEDEEMDYE